MANPSLQELNKPHSWAQIWKTLQTKQPTQYTQRAEKSPRQSQDSQLRVAKQEGMQAGAT